MNKSAKIFLTFSTIYLCLLTFVLLTQPHSGYSATIEEVLLSYSLFIPLWGLTACVAFVLKRYSDRNWYKTALATKTLFGFIILSVIIGFIFNFDYQRQSGCFIENEAGLSLTKFIFSIGSIVLLSTGYYLSNNKFGVAILMAEFVIWTFKTMYFNTSLGLLLPGYFTMTCWMLRVFFIIKVLSRQAAYIADTKRTANTGLLL